MSLTLEKQEVTPSGLQSGLTPEQEAKVRGVVVDKQIEMLRPRPIRRLPTHLKFGMLRCPLLKMVKAIPLNIVRKPQSVVAHWEEIDEFGYGRNMSEAVDDFGRTVEELYLSLKERQSTLSNDLLKTWTTLNKYIQERA